MQMHHPYEGVRCTYSIPCTGPAAHHCKYVINHGSAQFHTSLWLKRLLRYLQNSRRWRADKILMIHTHRQTDRQTDRRRTCQHTWQISSRHVINNCARSLRMPLNGPLSSAPSCLQPAQVAVAGGEPSRPVQPHAAGLRRRAEAAQRRRRPRTEGEPPAERGDAQRRLVEERDDGAAREGGARPEGGRGSLPEVR